jgi:hypothetical protein
LDANSLYGWAMSQLMPLKDFKWNNEEWTREKILTLVDNAPIGYTFDVDLKYHIEFHYKHSDYPLAPKNIINNDYSKLH